MDDTLPSGWMIHEVCNVVRWVAQYEPGCDGIWEREEGWCWRNKDRKDWCMLCLARKLVEEAEEVG